MVKNLTPSDLENILKSETDLKLIDVREEWEFKTAQIKGAELMPLGKFMEDSEGLDKNAKIIIYCHHGIRSYQACMYLVRLGYKDIYNLQGGIDLYAREIDNSIPLY